MVDVPKRASDDSLDHKSESGASEKHHGLHLESTPYNDNGEEEEDYPEGGRDALLTVAGAFLVNFIELGMSGVTGALQAQYSLDQLKHKTQSEIAWIGTFQLFVTFFFGAIIGRTFDSIGPKILIAIGTFLMVLGLMMISLCKEYYSFFLAQGLVLGAGSALVYGPSMACVSHWYKRKRAVMTSIASSGAAVGSIVLPISVNNLIIAVGFPWAIRIIGFISLALLTPAIFMVKARLRRKESIKFSSVIDFGGLRDIRYVLLCIGSMLHGFGLYNPLFYGQLFSEIKRYPRNVSTYIIAIANVGTLIGRIVSGLAADRFGPLNMLSIWCTISAFIVLCWIFVDSHQGFIAWAVFYGMFSGAFVPLQLPSIASFTEDMSRFGGRAGLSSAIDSFATLASGPIGGALLDVVHGKFDRMIVFSAVMCFGGSFFFTAARFAANKKVFVKC